jgi:glycerol-3-phosphate dehydrogenase
MERVDAVVVGAGVVGLATAWTLAREGRRVCVLERSARPGTGMSTRNSQVIHAGIYYPAHTLKSRLAVAGGPMLYDFCARHRVPHRRIGKLIVAAEGETGELERLLALGRTNGVAGLELVDADFVRAREPHVRPTPALYSPHTGIVDADALVHTLQQLCEDADVVILPSTAPTGADPRGEQLLISTPAETMLTSAVVNAAGLYADEVSALLGGRRFRIHPCRGEYAELVSEKRGLLNGLVYPLPHAHGHGLGVHLTKTVHGNVTLGPTVNYRSAKDDYESERLPLSAFLEPARKLLPSLTMEDLRPGPTGMRAKLHPPEERFADFLIERDEACPRLVHAAGIESPGLTACLAIGEMVEGLVSELL